MVVDEARIAELKRVAEISKPDALLFYFSNEDLRLLLGRIAELEEALIAWGKEERKADNAFSTAPILRVMHIRQELLDRDEAAALKGEAK
jgi:hypothetical protein